MIESDVSPVRRTLATTGPYSFTSSMRFLEGFTPADLGDARQDELQIAFPSDDAWRCAGVRVRSASDPDAAMEIEISGDADADLVERQVARIFSLDEDSTGYSEVIGRDPVLRQLGSRLPDLRPVLFFSPYEAAAWAIIGNRIRMTQAATVKTRMANELGRDVVVAGEQVHAFPPPDVLSRLDGFRGLTPRKLTFLRALGVAAMDGHLEPQRLRTMPGPDALAELRELPGIGEFSAELILIRGVGKTDMAPARETRLADGIRRVYGLADDVPDASVAGIVDRWRPFRTWVSVLIRSSA